jgi:hypothetical protein
MSNGPKDPPRPPADLFPFDEMSTGETSSLLRRAHVMNGAPDHPVPAQNQKDEAPLKPMTGAQLAFRPSAPPRVATGAQPAYKPQAGTQPAFKPISHTTQPGTKPSAAALASLRPAASPPVAQPPVEEAEEPPVFDAERLQAQIRSMSMHDSALGRAALKPGKPSKSPTSAVEDTFVKTKMKQAEAKVPDFDLDEDLG